MFRSSGFNGGEMMYCFHLTILIPRQHFSLQTHTDIHSHCLQMPLKHVFIVPLPKYGTKYWWFPYLHQTLSLSFTSNAQVKYNFQTRHYDGRLCATKINSFVTSMDDQWWQKHWNWISKFSNILMSLDRWVSKWLAKYWYKVFWICFMPFRH